jgi:hypothetical protein
MASTLLRLRSPAGRPRVALLAAQRAVRRGRAPGKHGWAYKPFALMSWSLRAVR